MPILFLHAAWASVVIFIYFLRKIYAATQCTLSLPVNRQLQIVLEIRKKYKNITTLAHAACKNKIGTKRIFLE